MFRLGVKFYPQAVINDSDESNSYFEAIHVVTGCYLLLVFFFFLFQLIFTDTNPEDLRVYGKM